MSHPNQPTNQAGQPQASGTLSLDRKFLILWDAADWAAWKQQCLQTRAHSGYPPPAPHSRKQSYRLSQEGVPKDIRRFVSLSEAHYLIGRFEREKESRRRWRDGQRAVGTYRPKWFY